ncbi:DUF2281 domain-containing protein [Nostoc sp. FACHB-280]|uniref:DUF2281 domain-containing protein n=1 Tax=Nostoc sp. FACHB-280 TaxID=2692839 RepID=UPI001F54F43F|nr:DUF2281 domain-containing protein [Nostoc sp. FACHB-280]
MNAQVVDTTSELISKVQTLAPEQKQQVLDFVEFLMQKYAQPEKAQETPQQRILGLNEKF